MVGILDIGKGLDSILDKFIPDASEKAKAKLALEELRDRDAARAHAEAMGQIETNKIEAAHASVFVSGWRPALGWIGATGAAAAFVIYPLSTMVQAWSAGTPIPEYPIDNLAAMILYLLGASGIRSFDKLKGTAFGSLGADPGLARTKVVEGSATPALAPKLPIETSPTGVPAANAREPETKEDDTLVLEPSKRKILWGDKVSPTFRERVLWIEQDLGLNADNLMACMAFETGQKFAADVRNLAGSSGTGLIQFMAYTATKLGTSTAALAKMTAEDQLNYVWKYFRQFGEDLSAWSLEDTYMAILYPAAIGKPLSWTFPWDRSGLAYRQNRGLDKNKDGKVTKAEACAGVYRMRDLGKKHMA